MLFDSQPLDPVRTKEFRFLQFQHTPLIQQPPFFSAKLLQPVSGQRRCHTGRQDTAQQHQHQGCPSDCGPTGSVGLWIVLADQA